MTAATLSGFATQIAAVFAKFQSHFTDIIDGWNDAGAGTIAASVFKCPVVDRTGLPMPRYGGDIVDDDDPISDTLATARRIGSAC